MSRSHQCREPVNYLLHAEISVKPGDGHFRGIWHVHIMGEVVTWVHMGIHCGRWWWSQPSDLLCRHKSHGGFKWRLAELSWIFEHLSEIVESTYFSFYSSHSLSNIGSFHPISHHFTSVLVRSANTHTHKPPYTLYAILRDMIFASTFPNTVCDLYSIFLHVSIFVDSFLRCMCFSSRQRNQNIQKCMKTKEYLGYFS